MNNMWQKSAIFFFSIGIATAALFRCSVGLTGTEVGNPAVVTGRVQDNSGKSVRGASVFLLTPNYNAVTDSTRSLSKTGESSLQMARLLETQRGEAVEVKTDSSGEFLIRGVKSGTYNIYISDSLAHNISFRDDIAIRQDSINLGIFRVSGPSYAALSVADTIFVGSGYIAMPGTPVKVPVSSAGQYTVPLIGDTLKVIYCNTLGDSIATVLNYKPVSASLPNPGDTIDLTGTEHILVPPILGVLQMGDTTFSPAPIFLYGSDSLFSIVAAGAFSSKGHVLEYQFYEMPSKVLSSWDTTNILPLWIDSTGNYSVSCRVRSRSDRSIISSWTPALRLVVLDTSETFSIKAPATPVQLDTFPFRFSLPYRFAVSGGQNLDSSLVQYRLSWQDTTSFIQMSSWANDSVVAVTFTNPGLYFIRAQARSAIDTTRVSIWSDTLNVYIR